MNKRHFKTRCYLLLQKSIIFVLFFVLVFSDLQALLSVSFLPKIEEAHALSGDFSIFRNASDATALTTTSFDTTWDTTVVSNTDIVLQTGDAAIDLAEGGKYLVMYNVFASEAGGTFRRSIQTNLQLDGVDIPYGYGDGYIRDQSGDLDSYNSGAAIIDATAGQDLTVVTVRDDANPTGLVNIRTNKNGVSILKLKDGFDYLRVKKTSDTIGIDTNTTFTDVVWDANDEVDTDSFGFTNGNSAATLKGTNGSHFLVTTNVHLKQTAASNLRLNYEMRLTLGGVEVPGSRVTSYLRGNQNSNGIYDGTLAYSGIVQKNIVGNQDLKIQIRRESAGSTAATDIVANKSALSIVALPDNADYVSLTTTGGTQNINTTRSAFNWNDEKEVDSGSFSHSNVTNNSRISLDATSDYLFFSTAYTSRTSSGARSAPVIEWQLDGGSVYQYGGHGSFNRGDQGANDAFTSGSSGGIILDGITGGSYLEVTRVDEAASTNNVFPAAQISVQGVELSKLFISDVDVGVSGSHTATTSIPSTEVYSGGVFSIGSNATAQTITSIRLTESGTVDGAEGIENIALYYDLDNTAPYDCASESFSTPAGETQFSTTDANGFSGADGISTFSGGSVSITTTQTMCLYAVYDVNSTSTDTQTVKISIENPEADITMVGSPTVNTKSSLSPSGVTTLENAELTMTHYHWRHDDGNEGGSGSGANSIENAEDTSAIGFSNGTPRRLRIQVSAEGSVTSSAVAYRLEYAQKISTCDAVTTWTDVGTGGGGDWDMVNTSGLTDGSNTTDITGSTKGALTNPVGHTFLVSNSGQKDTSSETTALSLTGTQFVELEYTLEPTSGAPQGNTYCFRVSDAGTSLRNYDIYAEGTISADIDVGTLGTQNTSINSGSTNQYVGGTFSIARSGTARSLTSLSITETGTIDAQTNLDNILIRYDMDTSAPRDCVGESYSGAEPQFGVTDTDGFSSANGSSTFTHAGLSLDNGANGTFCGYVIVDVGSAAINGETILIEVADPSTEVLVNSSTVGPSTAVVLAGVTTIAGSVLTQGSYHWRNDNGTESGATSATGGVENTPLNNIAQNATQRLRVSVENQGTVTSSATQYQIEYGAKVTTCSAVGSWHTVGGVDAAFAMVATSQLVEAANTTNISVAIGGITDIGGKTFRTPNAAQRESTSKTGNITLSNTQFLEAEYAIEATDKSGYDTTYCFRVTDSGTALPSYLNYPELTTRVKQDFYVQRGVTTVTGSGSTIVAGTDYIAPVGSAFIRITNSQITGAGRNAGGGQQNADDVTAYISNPSNLATSITFSRPAAATNNTRVSWEIVEYVGLAGADNEMIVRNTGTVSYASGVLTANGVAVPTVVDDNDVVVFITGQLNNNAGTNDYNDGLSTSDWNAITDVPTFARAASDPTVSLSYAVVEFTGANWKIQRIEHAYTGAGSAETEAISAISSVSSTFVHAQKRVANPDFNLDELGHTVWLSSVGFVSLKLRSGVSNPTGHTSVVWVVENTQTGNGALEVYRSNGTITSGGSEPESNSVAIGATINMQNSSIFVNNDSTGAGNFHPRTILGAIITSTTQYELWNSDTGQNQDYRTEVIEWPVAEVALRQNYYRFYVDNDSIDPTDPYPLGVSDLGENTSITGADSPLGENDRVRIRMSIAVSNAALPTDIKAFKLQYGKRSIACSAISTWNDIGAPGSGEIWRGFSGSVADGTVLATSTPAPGTLNISVSDVAGTYESQNNSALNPYAVDIGEDVEYDWLIEHNGATQLSDYCFRMVESDGSLLAGYNNYPTLRTTGYTPIVSNWRWYDDATSLTPSTALDAEGVTPINLSGGNNIKLRLTAAEVEGAPGNNVKFRLQYSESADFNSAVYDVTASSSCTASSTWCYTDGAGVDNAVINASVISDADSCVGGVGSGCGTHNEFPGTASTHTQASFSTMEYEFTLKPMSPRVNAVYYFRMYDVLNEIGISASSTYPSIQIEGASLVFTMDGSTSGLTIGDITSDVTTTANSIPFASVPFATEYEAVHQISVNTNATEGYQMFVFMDQELTNSYGSTIPSVTGSNATPLSWAAACASSAPACFGYHTTDTGLSGISPGRFGPDNTYAAFTTTPQEVMYKSTPTDDSYDMVYKIQVSEDQPSGNYEATLTYIAVPVF